MNDVLEYDVIVFPINDDILEENAMFEHSSLSQSKTLQIHFHYEYSKKKKKSFD